ncbi:glycosyltransferase [Thermosynechococcus sp. HN-54]|uniref:glycosyltransferase family 2 protein n=1 Tax=Thermosynechococcus sp. HN-54 TaxID=2933959 RepID=UPI00202CBD73|nr:glycosyltransferase family 2 protein [Thermosynechococcus sp. HN-54]URR35624.1 glycosyltransferase [Thermosynechococcus sp. HN-54]
MSNLPKVSILIPTYNQEQFILEAVHSALRQTYPNLEVIVGDDNSSDKTPFLIRQITDPRLIYIRNQQNLGRVRNYQNLLYNYASGEWVLCLDGDDYLIDDHFVSDAIDLIDERVVIIAANIFKLLPNGETVSYRLPAESEILGQELLKKLPDSRYFFKHAATLYQRKEATLINFYSFDSPSSDWESLYRLAQHGRVRYLKKTVAIWRIHGANASKQLDVYELLENLQIWDRIFNYARDLGFSKWLAVYLCRKCVLRMFNGFLFDLMKNIGDEAAVSFKTVFTLSLKMKEKYPFFWLSWIFYPVLATQALVLIIGFTVGMTLRKSVTTKLL